jgi:hypothetical protein
MTTLVISTPWYKKDEATGQSIGKPGQSHSWEKFFQTGKGLGYILYPDEFAKLQQGIIKGSSKLVMLRQGRGQRRAEARLTKLVQTPRQAKNGQWRYDVSFEDQKEVKPYVYLPAEKLKRNGVKVIITGNDC